MLNVQVNGYTNKQQEFAIENNGRSTTGGVTSDVLRYPHLIRELIEIKKQEKEKPDTNVLILGPGLSVVNKSSSPHLHEMAAAFSKNAHITVVDIDDNLISEIGKSTFGFNERFIAESVLKTREGHNVKKYTLNEIDDIRDYIKEIPEKVTQNLEVQKEDFTKFKASRSYDYIFATQSLMYTYLNFQSLERQEERKNSLLLTAKYLGSLKNNGVLVVDEMCYMLMRKQQTALPDPNSLKEAAIRWDYKTKNSSTPFTARKVEIPNDSERLERIPRVYYKDQKNWSRDISTMNLYFIKREKIDSLQKPLVIGQALRLV